VFDDGDVAAGRAEDTERMLRLGDEVKIKVARVNQEEGKVDFTLIS